MTKMAKWQRKLTLLIKSEKRLGANQLVNEYQQTDFSQMKNHILAPNMPSLLDDIIQKYPQLSNISERPIEPVNSNKDYEPKRYRDLYTHLHNLKHEFEGQSELNFYHAIVIVLIRRGYKTFETFQQFEQLWLSEMDYLLSTLSLRWIVSAADTFIDHSSSPIRRTILMNIVTLINSLKAYETSQYLMANPNQQDEKIEALRAKHCPLYDGLTFYRIGTDDTLKHMRMRYQSFGELDAFATKMLLTVFDRLHDNPTAFTLLKQLHTDETSAWW